MMKNANIVFFAGAMSCVAMADVLTSKNAIVGIPVAHEGAPLELSVQNEVDYAIDRALAVIGTNKNVSATCEKKILSAFGLEGFSKGDLAIKIVSSQRSDGRWLIGTNDVTSVMVEILKKM